MTRTSFVGLSLAVALAGAATWSTAEAGCRRAGGVATMVTKDLAIFMANAALKNSIAGNDSRWVFLLTSEGWRPSLSA
jgi:hypothetical protein